MDWTASGADILSVQNDGFTKIADKTTYAAHNIDSNGAEANYRSQFPPAAYEANPHIEGTTKLQTPDSIANPVPSSQIDITGAFMLYPGN